MWPVGIGWRATLLRWRILSRLHLPDPLKEVCMFRMDSNHLRSCGLAMAMAFAGVAAFLPAAPVFAQSAPQPRSLPDFTELVDQAGPAVVNIRTLEHARAGARGDGQMDEEMQEFFRRFFGVPMPNPPRGGGGGGSGGGGGGGGQQKPTPPRGG